MQFRSRPWIAAAILGSALVGACTLDPQPPLNPQPLPPASDQNGSADASSHQTVGSSSSSGGSGSSGGGALNSSSGGGSSSGSSSGTSTSSSSDAQAPPGAHDASTENSDSGAVIDAATDTGPANDGGADGAPTDAALDDGSAEGSADNGGCVRALDCYASHPGACAVCMWPLNYAVCVEHRCGCACDGRDASGE